MRFIASKQKNLIVIFQHNKAFPVCEKYKVVWQKLGCKLVLT